jgi:hypothetical protein
MRKTKSTLFIFISLAVPFIVPTTFLVISCTKKNTESFEIIGASNFYHYTYDDAKHSKHFLNDATTNPFKYIALKDVCESFLYSDYSKTPEQGIGGNANCVDYVLRVEITMGKNDVIHHFRYICMFTYYTTDPNSINFIFVDFANTKDIYFHITEREYLCPSKNGVGFILGNHELSDPTPCLSGYAKGWEESDVHKTEISGVGSSLNDHYFN